MSSASGTHPALALAKRMVAVAPDKLRAIQDEGLRLAPLIGRSEITRHEAAVCLIESASAFGLCRTAREREIVEHVIRMALSGQPAGVGCSKIGELAETCSNPSLRPIDISEFLKMELPPRRPILSPWLSEKGTAMLYSLRGISKTLLGLSVGNAVASGGDLLGWSAPEPHRVLYVDGEMPAAEMQHRLAGIVAGLPRKASPDHFRILNADITESGFPDLATNEGQRVFDDVIGNAELIIIDNISTLCRSGKENEAEGRQAMQDWALAHRRAGRSLLFVHHAGKGGNQRGTSKREDILDSVIALRRPQDYHADQGARFEVHFEKHRGFHGADAEPFEARYEVRDGAAIWTRTEKANADVKRVADALGAGLSIRETATKLGMHKSMVERLKPKAKEQGLLNDRPGPASRRLAA